MPRLPRAAIKLVQKVLHTANLQTVSIQANKLQASFCLKNSHPFLQGYAILCSYQGARVALRTKALEAGEALAAPNSIRQIVVAATPQPQNEL